MKFSILDVPERLSNHSEVHEGGGETQYVPNPDPDTEPSIYTPREEAHQMIYDLAAQDGWAALYDPTNEDSLIFDGGEVVGIRDSLGNFPDLYNIDDFLGGVTAAEVKPFGATKFYSGTVSSEWPSPPPSFTVLSAAMVAEADPNELPATIVFSGANPLGGGDSYICASYNAPGSNLQRVISSSDQEERLFEWAAQDNGQIITYLTSTGVVYSGYRKLNPDEIVAAEEVEPITHLTMGDPWAVFGGGPRDNGFGPTLFADGEVDPVAHQRMVALLSQLTGSTVGLPPGAPDEPMYYATLDETGKRTVGHMPHKPDPLASVVKVVTCFVARKLFVSDAMLDDLITLHDPYASSNTPNVEAGDQITWRDAFYASMHRSHNYITQNMAYHCGLMDDPLSEDPRAHFMSLVQDLADNEWGWYGAELNNAQGGSSKASAQQIGELLKMVEAEDPWLFGVMGGESHTYTIHRDGGQDEVTLPSLTLKDVSGERLFPELLASKSGSLAVTKTAAQAWYNPISDQRNFTTILRSPDNTVSGRWRSLREVLDASRAPHPPPPGYVSESGSEVVWGRDNANYVVASQPYTHLGEAITINPLSPDSVLRPVVRKGDKVTVKADIRGSSSAYKTLEMSITGGSFQDEEEALLILNPSGGWVLGATIEGTVRNGGYLSVLISAPRGVDNEWLRVRNISVTVESEDREIYEYQMDVETFSVTESSQSHDSNDSSGTVGEFSVQVQKPLLSSVFSEYGHGFIRNKQVRLDTWYGSLLGTAGDVSLTNSHSLTISGVSEMGPLNAYNVVAPPFTGTLVGLIETYFSLVSDAAPMFSVHPDLLGRTITAPGWKGELWYHLKLLCAAERIQISLRPEGGVFVSPSVAHEMEKVPLTDLGVSFQSSGLAESVEVYHYGSKWVDNSIVYPPGGWDEEVEIISVNAGEITEHTLEISASLKTFQEPQMVEHVGPFDENQSVYTIVGDDGFPVKPAQWAANGGRVEFTLGEDTRTIHVSVTGATGISNDQGEKMRTFSLALASDTSGSRYSTLRILGTGVVFNRRLVRFPTGVPRELTGTEIGATIDNPFISTMGQAAQAGSLAAYKFAGASPELTETSLGPHLGKWGADVLSGMITTDIANYRVREVTYTPEGASLSGDYYLSYDDFSFEGTYDDFNNANEGLTYADVQSRGNKYA